MKRSSNREITSRIAVLTTDPSRFTIHIVPKILTEIEMPSTQFIFSDRSVIVARYLHARGFRNCVMYCCGDVPKHTIGNYPLKKGFTSIGELNESLKIDADKILD